MIVIYYKCMIEWAKSYVENDMNFHISPAIA